MGNTSPRSTGRSIGFDLPDGARFIGPEPDAVPAWRPGDAPADADLDACVACGLCLPHCPTYLLTGEESASPRGRIAAMRAVSEGVGEVDDTFATFMDLCLVCRACEDVCPSHVPFGRMMERARVQIEPDRGVGARLVRRLGLDLTLPHRWLLVAATTLTPLVRPLLPRRVRALAPRGIRRGARVPRVTDPPAGTPWRGTVTMLTGCVQDQWFRPVNRATVRVLARNGWRVQVPRAQSCCGALAAHNGHLDTARVAARRALVDFPDHLGPVIVNAAGCGAHLRELDQLLPGDERAASLSERAVDVMAFLYDRGIEPPTHGVGADVVAYHDACHALRAQHIREQPRRLLRSIPGLRVVDLPGGDRCCGAAGLYNVLEPELSGELRTQTSDAVLSTGAPIVASANPGCAMQLAAGLRDRASPVEVVHPVELLDRAYRGPA